MPPVTPAPLPDAPGAVDVTLDLTRLCIQSGVLHLSKRMEEALPTGTLTLRDAERDTEVRLTRTTPREVHGLRAYFAALDLHANDQVLLRVQPDGAGYVTVRRRPRRTPAPSKPLATPDEPVAAPEPDHGEPHFLTWTPPAPPAPPDRPQRPSAVVTAAPDEAPAPPPPPDDTASPALEPPAKQESPTSQPAPARSVRGAPRGEAARPSLGAARQRAREWWQHFARPPQRSDEDFTGAFDPPTFTPRPESLPRDDGPVESPVLDRPDPIPAPPPPSTPAVRPDAPADRPGAPTGTPNAVAGEGTLEAVREALRSPDAPTIVRPAWLAAATDVPVDVAAAALKTLSEDPDMHLNRVREDAFMLKRASL